MDVCFPPIIKVNFSCLRRWLLLALIPCTALPASAAIRYVDRDASGANNGTSWANACTTLQAAVTAAVSGDQIWIAAGIYRPNDHAPENISRSLYFTLKRGVSTYGGFAGTESSLVERNPKLNPVILSGDLLGNDSAGNLHALSSDESKADNVYHVIGEFDSTSVLDTVTIRGGNANGTSGNASGGVMSIYGSLTVTNCVFMDNSAINGGAIAISGGSNVRSTGPTFNGCTFSHNKATGQGGALYNRDNGAPILINCTLAENQAQWGGAIFNRGSNLLAANCTIAFNSSAVDITGTNAYGSGIRSVLSASLDFMSNIYLFNCILWGNRNSAQLYGGAMTIMNTISQGGPSQIISEAKGNTLTNVSGLDPQLTLLGDHGGGMPTITFPASSPAINAGTISTGTSLAMVPATDQRGITRDARPDIGATEHPVYGGPGTAEIAIGGSATLPVSTALPSPTFQWYRGATGDTSTPINGATGASFPTPPLDQGTDYWAAVTSGGETYASPTIPVPVRGTFSQWVAFHRLQETDAGANACPAGDGIPNLIKYAAGLSPLSPAGDSPCLRTVRDAASGDVWIDLTLSLTPTDLTWRMFESPDLRQWAPSTRVVSPAATSTARKTHRLSVPPSQPAGFFEVRFEKID